MKKKVLFLGISFLLFISMAQAEEVAELVVSKPLDKIVATVNRKIITQSELMTQIEQVRQQARQQNRPLPPASLLRKEVLNRLIETKLQLQLATRHGIVVTDKALNSAIAKIAKRNNISMAALREKVKQQDLSFKTYRENIRKQITISRFQSIVLKQQIKVTPAQISKMLKKMRKENKLNAQYHLKDVFIELPEAPSQAQIKAAQQQAQQTIALLKASNGSTSNVTVKENDLGWRRLRDLPDVFAKPVRKMKKNQVVGPIRTANGLHILKLIDSHRMSIDKKVAQQQATQLLYRQQSMKVLTKWLKQLRAHAYIKIMV